MNTPFRNSVEILPGDGSAWLGSEEELQTAPKQAFLLVDNNLGIPQKILYKAYLEASAIFNRGYRGFSRSVHPYDDSDSSVKDIAYSSSVILATNPGHQTAWNARKRLVSSGMLDAQQELGFTTALLTIRDCAKHSILWHHRRWLLRRIYPPYHAKEYRTPSASTTTLRIPDLCADEDSLHNLDISPTTLREEFSACSIACSTYDRNYFAWSHRYRCFNALVEAVARTPDFHKITDEELAWCTQWVERHVSDYTAIQYRCNVVSMIAHSKFMIPRLETTWPDAHSEPTPGLWDHAKSLVESYPEHESLWLYLRGALYFNTGVPKGEKQLLENDDVTAFAQQFIPESFSVTALRGATSLDLVCPSRPIIKENFHNLAYRFILWFIREVRSCVGLLQTY